MTKLKAIIVDIDGTIAKKGDRDIYDYSKVHLDKPIEPVLTVLQCVCDQYTDVNYHRDIKVFFVSGREDSGAELTKRWLRKYTDFLWFESDRDWSELHMRKPGDNRCDTIVKREIYDQYIKDKYDVVAVFDDRPKVIRMWRELGLFVFNCCQHDEEF